MLLFVASEECILNGSWFVLVRGGPPDDLQVVEVVEFAVDSLAGVLGGAG